MNRVSGFSETKKKQIVKLLSIGKIERWKQNVYPTKNFKIYVLFSFLISLNEVKTHQVYTGVTLFKYGKYFYCAINFREFCSFSRK